MLLVKSFLKFSDIHGVGCFTAEDIRGGQIVWKMDPILDVEIEADKIDRYPPAIKSFLQMYAYGQLAGPGKTFILCGDHARHMNHSENPNLIEAGDSSNIAARDIKAGEELTCDYNAFDTDATFKLHHNQ
jgi:uncharacterized protein